jgi:hypothetical protein
MAEAPRLYPETQTISVSYSRAVCGLATFSKAKTIEKRTPIPMDVVAKPLTTPARYATSKADSRLNLQIRNYL